MRRKIRIGLLILLMTLSALVGCGESDKDSGNRKRDNRNRAKNEDITPVPTSKNTPTSSPTNTPTPTPSPTNTPTPSPTPTPAKYPVKVTVDFPGNYFWDKYDVMMYIDGNPTASYAHGRGSTFSVSLEKGNHEVVFAKDDDININGKTTLVVEGRTEVAYRIACETKYVTVKETFIDHIREMNEDEIRIEWSKRDFIDKDYHNVIQELEKCGFVNIRTYPVYDIYLGFTEEDSVKSITIDGKENFTKGDIFNKQVEIVIAYHLWEEDDPNRPTNTPTPTSTPKPTPTTRQEKKLDYTTNDELTAENGNAGMYSYKRMGGTEDYWPEYVVVDFDNMLVDFFMPEGYVNRFRLDSGNLNETAYAVCYGKEGGGIVGLCFMFVKHPDKLVVSTMNGGRGEYKASNLQNLIKKRESMEIRDYSKKQ